MNKNLTNSGIVSLGLKLDPTRIWSHFHIHPTAATKGMFSGKYKQILYAIHLTRIMLGPKKNDEFVFGGVEYEVKEVLSVINI